ncbi:hypothetical protein [Alicyclobacillus herbarius]|uniref:hypothetical protein n=1 Tax=Alicyclobacillus herbarius TaxID=122960 RepID=UPI00047B6159|nr:hypothetical protein [Alicyclobacillus herbarius]
MKGEDRESCACLAEAEIIGEEVRCAWDGYKQHVLLYKRLVPWPACTSTGSSVRDVAKSEEWQGHL